MKHLAKWLLILSVALMSVVVLCGIITYHELSRHTLKVTFLNIGQGDSVFIEAPNGVQFLIDGGPGSAVVSELTSVMPFYDRSIDVVLATHPDSDHVAGLIDVLNRYQVGEFVRTDVVASSSIYIEVLNQVEGHYVPTIHAKRGQRFVLDAQAEVYVDVLFPERSVRTLETNTSSIVVMLRHRNVTFLLTGDSPKGIEKFLSKVEGENLHANILKLGHHGSHSSSDEIFLKAVHPDVAVISAGKNNKYGHPHKDVIELLAKLGIPYTTTLDGRRVFESDGYSAREMKP